MSIQTSNAGTMKEAMKQALQQNNPATPSTISMLIELLGEAQEALREGGYTKAVLDIRRGLQTNYGLRYTAYIRDETSTFENSLFSVFVGDDLCAFQAEGQTERDLNADDIISKAQEYLLRPYIVDLMTGLLRQFSRSSSVSALDTSMITV